MSPWAQELAFSGDLRLTLRNKQPHFKMREERTKKLEDPAGLD